MEFTAFGDIRLACWRRLSCQRPKIKILLASNYQITQLPISLASLFTHAFAAASLGQAGKANWRKDWRFWYVAVLCSILPDIDVLGFRFGIRYGALWGHRGMTHSLLFAIFVAAVMSLRFRLPASERLKLAGILFVIAASHGLLDAMTNGGLGVAFFSPFDRERYFLPWTPIEVSPIGAGGFLSSRGLEAIWSEIVWLWGPLVVTGATLYVLAHRAREKVDTLKKLQNRDVDQL